MDKHAHVVGGGIGGLTAAACLARRGWKVTVHERTSQLREIGAGIYLKENSLRVLEELQWLDEILPHCNRVRHTFIDDRGRLLRHASYGDERVYTILRQDLHRKLAECAQRWGATIVVDSNVEDVRPDGSLRVSGKELHADLIVGADGVGSIVRQRAGLEDSVVRIGSGSTRMLVRRKPGDTIDTSGEYWSGHNRVLVGPISEDILYVCCSSREDDARGVALPLDVEYWSSRFPQLADVFSRFETGVHHVHPKVRVKSWHKGCIALLGDAAHGQPPNLGQGAGMAIFNASVLAEELARHADIENALARWEARQRKLTLQVQNWSLGWESVMHRWPLPLQRLRALFVLSLAKFPATRRHWQGLYRGLGSQA
jgi:2-polyprenyl-6-methoxyphenol hydroxylase-like FAD-dependent oxidoreductase